MLRDREGSGSDRDRGGAIRNRENRGLGCAGFGLDRDGPCGIGGVRYRREPGLGDPPVLGTLGAEGAPGPAGEPVPGEGTPARGQPVLTVARRWPPVPVPSAAPRCMDWYMMNCELLATCSALGYLEGDVYHREPDCLGR